MISKTTVLLAFLTAVTASLTAKAQPEESRIVSLEMIGQQFPALSMMLDEVQKSHAVASSGLIRSPFVPSGSMIPLARVESRISSDPDLCQSTLGRALFFDRDGTGRDLYQIVSSTTVDGSPPKCEALLVGPIEATQTIAPSVRLIRAVALENSLNLSIAKGSEALSETRIWKNGADEVAEIHFYQFLDPAVDPENPLVAVNPRDDGVAQVRLLVFNFPLNIGFVDG